MQSLEVTITYHENLYFKKRFPRAPKFFVSYQFQSPIGISLGLTDNIICETKFTFVISISYLYKTPRCKPVLADYGSCMSCSILCSERHILSLHGKILNQNEIVI